MEEWRKAVDKFGYTTELKRAAKVLLRLDDIDVRLFETISRELMYGLREEQDMAMNILLR